MRIQGMLFTAISKSARRGALAVIFLAALCGRAAATSPPAPPPPTIAEIVEHTQVVFTGRVESVTWQPIVPEVANAGNIVPNVRVAKRLMAYPGLIPKRIVYVAGSVSMTEAQTKERYLGNSYVLVGYVFRLPSGETKVMVPSSAAPPYELSTVAEFKREIAKVKRIPGPDAQWPGPL